MSENGKRLLAMALVGMGVGWIAPGPVQTVAGSVCFSIALLLLTERGGK